MRFFFFHFLPKKGFKKILVPKNTFYVFHLWRFFSVFLKSMPIQLVKKKTKKKSDCEKKCIFCVFSRILCHFVSFLDPILGVFDPFLGVFWPKALVIKLNTKKWKKVVQKGTKVCFLGFKKASKKLHKIFFSKYFQLFSIISKKPNETDVLFILLFFRLFFFNEKRSLSPPTWC